MSQPAYRLPTTGALNDDLDAIEPDARPVPLKPRDPARDRRKIATARRSRLRLAPNQRYFYWCAFCNYCNTPAEGRNARCPHHLAEYEADRKATARGSVEPEPDDGTLRLSAQQFDDLWAKASRLSRAQRRLEQAVHQGNPNRALPDLNQAITALLSAITSLRRPPDR